MTWPLDKNTDGSPVEGKNEEQNYVWRRFVTKDHPGLHKFDRFHPDDKTHLRTVYKWRNNPFTEYLTLEEALSAKPSQ